MHEMDSNDSGTVREALQERADAFVVPPTGDGTAVVAVARQADRRRRVGVGAGSLAAAVAVTALALGPRWASAPPPPLPASSSTQSTESAVPESLRSARSAAVAWAEKLPVVPGGVATGWPDTRLRGDGVSVRIDGRDVALPAGFTDLAEPRRTADGWLFVASGASMGRSALLHVTRDGWKVLARPSGPTPLLMDPDGRRVALLVPDDRPSLLVIDVATGSIGAFGVPTSVRHPSLAAWTPFGIRLVDLPTATGGTTPITMFQTATSQWVEDRALLDASILDVVRLDAFGTSPISPLVSTRQGSQVCLSRFESATTLIPLECWPRSSGARPTVRVSPGGRYALVGAAGVEGAGVTLRDLATGRDVPGVPAQALSAGIDAYLWTGPDTFGSVVAPVGSPDLAVAYRYDLSTRRAARLTDDPRVVLDRAYDPARTGLTLPDGARG